MRILKKIKKNKFRSLGNLTKKEKTALKSLRDNHELMVKLADKGGNIVIMENHQYQEMCENILQNDTWYKKISIATIEKYNKDFYALIDEGFTNGAISRETWEFIRTIHPHSPTF